MNSLAFRRIALAQGCLPDAPQPAAATPSAKTTAEPRPDATAAGSDPRMGDAQPPAHAKP